MEGIVNWIIAVTVLATAIAGGAFADGELKITDIQGIRIERPVNGTLKTAAKDLRTALNRMYNLGNLPLLPTKTAGAAVVLGRKQALAEGRVTQEEMGRATPDGYVIKVDGKGIVIAGTDRWATRFGVYALLEKLGVRFFGHSIGAAKYPKNPPRFIKPFVLIDKPVFRYRNGRSFVQREMFNLIADPRKGLDPELFDRKKTGSDLWTDHSAGYLIPKLKYYDQHPEYYAMLPDGKRIAKDAFTDHRTPLCLSNPDVHRIAKQRALAWVRMESEKRFFMITYGDSGVWCQCPNCLKLDPAPGQYATRLLQWVNPIARAIAEKHPDRMVVTFAYGGTDAPPPTIRPEPNVCIVGSTGAGNIPFWDHAVALESPALKSNLKKIDGWLAVKPALFCVCEYHSGMYRPALIDTEVARMRFYAKRGLGGIFFTYGHSPNFSNVWGYVFSKLHWNPYQDGQALAEEYIDENYGRAASAVKTYFRLAHERYEATLKDLKQSLAKAKTREERPKLDSHYPPDFYENDFARHAAGSLLEAHRILKAEAGAIKRPKDPRKARQFAAAKRTANARANNMAREVELFIRDWMSHPIAKKLDDQARDIIKFQLETMLALVGDTQKEKTAFLRRADTSAVSLDNRLPGARNVVQAWFKEKNLVVQRGVKTADGIQFSGQDFMFGFGPIKLTTGPPRMASGIYVKGNSAGRSQMMEVDFVLDKVPGAGAAALEVWGQDSDHDVAAAEIRIEINGKTIFEGPVTVVKCNWSQQNFTIPPGILKAGGNKLRFVNTAAPDSIKKWWERWFFVASARIRFKAAPNR